MAQPILCPLHEQQPTAADVDAAAKLLAANPAPPWLVAVDPHIDFLHVQMLAESDGVSETIRDVVTETGVPVVITKLLVQPDGLGVPLTIVVA